MFRIEGFAMIRDFKDKFQGSEVNFDVNRTRATPIRMQVDVGEGLIDRTENLSRIEVVEAGVEGPAFSQIAQAMQTRRSELDIDQGFGGGGGLGHRETVSRWESDRGRLCRF